MPSARIVAPFQAGPAGAHADRAVSIRCSPIRSPNRPAEASTRSASACWPTRRSPRLHRRGDEQIVARCTEVETGARNIDHIVNKTLLPQIATEILMRDDSSEPSMSAVDVGRTVISSTFARRARRKRARRRHDPIFCDAGEGIWRDPLSIVGRAHSADEQPCHERNLERLLARRLDGDPADQRRAGGSWCSIARCGRCMLVTKPRRQLRQRKYETGADLHRRPPLHLPPPMCAAVTGRIVTCRIYPITAMIHQHVSRRSRPDTSPARSSGPLWTSTGPALGVLQLINLGRNMVAKRGIAGRIRTPGAYHRVLCGGAIAIARCSTTIAA